MIPPSITLAPCEVPASVWAAEASPAPMAWTTSAMTSITIKIVASIVAYQIKREGTELGKPRTLLWRESAVLWTVYFHNGTKNKEACCAQESGTGLRFMSSGVKRRTYLWQRTI